MLGHHDHDRDGSRLPHGREDTGIFWRDFFDAVPDAEVVVEGLAVDGDDVLGQVAVRGTHTGDTLGFPGTGRPVLLHEADIWQVSDSILAGHWHELRETTLFRQLWQR
ncbi:ester cyclase [Catenulispora subtropica]|uniref:SnoaL-like polyketide cyclase n=1 Tax=Catenulispora subtropica TaxID=450798 RepID=A0ABN2SV28_9ACTN